MIDCKRWDVVTALFPFTDAPIKKPRPMLILSNVTFNRSHGHVIGCMITTGANSTWPSDHRIADLPACGLSHPSLVRWKVFTLPTHLLGRRIGALAEGDKVSVAAMLARIMGWRREGDR
jgi:mRNA-degrading endonuclease toxin of MazEF toxin-antitoxin module